MRKARWLAGWRKSAGKPVFYHVISRVVDRRFVFGAEEKEKFRALMRLQEKFTGCRVVSYCLMCNHFHILLEVPPMAEGGLSDEELLKRLSAIYSEAFVAGVAKELADARTVVYANETGLDEAVKAIHKRFTYRMQDLGRVHEGPAAAFHAMVQPGAFQDGAAVGGPVQERDRGGRRGGEDDFRLHRSESGARRDGEGPGGLPLEQLRRGDRWRRERAMGKRRGRVWCGHCGRIKELAADADLWASGVSREYRKLLMAGAVGKSSESVGRDGKWRSRKTLRKGISKEEAEREREMDGEIPFGKMLRCRVRYFTDGAVIGSRSFVNEAFAKSRERFGPKRKDGARKLRGNATAAAGLLWGMRDLRKNIG